jgi:four helix bundle protein
VAQSIFELTNRFPREETYSLTDQLRRASRSIGAQIAEAWAKRRYRRSFVAKLTDALGEQMETEHWIQVAASCGYLGPDNAKVLLDDLDEVGRMLHSMIDKAGLFCGELPPRPR